MKEVQAVIMNISFPKYLDEVLDIQKKHGYFDLEYIINLSNDCDSSDYWTMPKWFKTDDVVFFMHSKNSKTTISRLKNQLKRESENYEINDIQLISEALERGYDLYSQYGGKIFALGRAIDQPVYGVMYEPDYTPHWKHRIYANISDYYCLKYPIDLSEFNTFIKLSCGGAITPVFGKEFNSLKSLIQKKNTIPYYLEDSVAMPIPLARINEDNWIEVTSKYRRSFRYEIQFRTFYVDYLLRFLGDQKTFFVECPCKKRGGHISYVDNVIIINEAYLPVEVKLNAGAEENLISQLKKYCDLDTLTLNKTGRYAPSNKLFRDGVLLIDTNAVYWYNYSQNSISMICRLDNISTLKDIIDLRKHIVAIMNYKERLI